MASSSISFSQMNVQNRKPFSIERRPKLLKDFLNDNSSSCSSNGFKSFPRHQPFNIPKIDSKTKNPKSSSSSSSSTTISAFQAVINAVRNIQFTTVKSPSFLPRSLSRRLSKRESRAKRQDQEVKENEVKISVKVKDILRWTSFRDIVDEISPPLDFTNSPHHSTTTTGSVDSSFNSNGSSWCESDLNAEFLPSWSGNCGVKELEVGKKVFTCVGLDSVETTTETANYTAGVPQDGDMLFHEEDEQQSPVSVFDFQFRENEEHFSTFDHSLANVERARQKLIQKIKRFESLAKLEPLNSEEWMSTEESTDFEEEENDDDEEEDEYGLVEERARELLLQVKETSSSKSCEAIEDQLLLDFFRDEMRPVKSHESKYDEHNWEMVSLAKAWLSGEQKAVLGWGFEYNREVYIREMHKEGKWSQFEFEQEELALEIEAVMFGQLIDDVLVDLFVK